MTAEELCAALGITPQRLAAWKKRGLPYRRDGRRHVYDAVEVRAWLVSEGIAESPRIVKTRDQVAEHFGVHLRTVATWMGAGCPGQPGAYDLDQIAAWRDEQRRATADPMLSGSKDHALTRYRVAKAELAELELATLRRNLIPRAEVHLVFERIAGHCRRTIETLAKHHGTEAADLVRDMIRTIRRDIESLDTADA